MSSISTVLIYWLINNSWGNFFIMTKKLGLLNLLPSYLFYFHNKLSGWGCVAITPLMTLVPLIPKISPSGGGDWGYPPTTKKIGLPPRSPTVLPQKCWFCNLHAVFGHFAQIVPPTNWPHSGNPDTIAPLTVYSNATSSIAPLKV